MGARQQIRRGRGRDVRASRYDFASKAMSTRFKPVYYKEPAQGPKVLSPEEVKQRLLARKKGKLDG